MEKIKNKKSKMKWSLNNNNNNNNGWRIKFNRLSLFSGGFKGKR